jgi:hypothetical protein
MNELLNLTDEAFAEELSEAIWEPNVWPKFVEEATIGRTIFALADLRDSLVGQFEKYKPQGDLAWQARTLSLLRKVKSRHTQANVIRRHNEKEDKKEARKAAEEGLSGVIFALASALEESNRSDLLDVIEFNDGQSVAEWMQRKTDQGHKGVLGES